MKGEVEQIALEAWDVCVNSYPDKPDSPSLPVNAIVRRALRQAFNEQHIKRVGYNAPESWLNNGMKHIEKDKLWRRVLQILEENPHA